MTDGIDVSDERKSSWGQPRSEGDETVVIEPVPDERQLRWHTRNPTTPHSADSHVALETVLKAFEGPAPRTTEEIAEQFGLSYRGALDALECLHERGDLDRKRVCEDAVVWWLVDTQPT